MAEIILASKSPARRMLLENAAVPFDATGSGVDEDVIKKECQAAGASLDETAMRLAVAKAMAVSAGKPDAYVIGADQILGLEGQGFDKPENMAEARERLIEFSGRHHILHTAACIVRQGQVAWQKTENPEMRMRDFTDAEIDTYLQEAGEDVLYCVGAYQLEGPGIRLFERIGGDYFSILGLPLLELLSFLRREALIGY